MGKKSKRQKQYAQPLLEANSPEPQQQHQQQQQQVASLQQEEDTVSIVMPQDDLQREDATPRGSPTSALSFKTVASERHSVRSSSSSAEHSAKNTAAAAAKTTTTPQGGFEVQWQELNYSYPTSVLARTLRAPIHKCASWWRTRRRSSGHSPHTSRRQQLSPVVLRDLSGGFRSNELVAIIGPSGCGKTTLLQFLAGNVGAERRRVRIAGIERPKVAFIGQDDDLLPGLSALETLVYASRLQNASANFDHVALATRLLEQLGLGECAHRNVAKLSGGQAKRVTIGQEILYPTDLLLLDEVTSGLDASTAYSIVRLLKRLVSDTHRPMSIVLSIHTPPAKLFSVFERVYVMSEGQCTYEGPCDVNKVNAYLRKFALECPRYHNIADYLIEIASAAAAVHDDDGDGEPDKLRSARDKMVEYQRKRAALSASAQIPSSIADEAQNPTVSISIAGDESFVMSSRKLCVTNDDDDDAAQRLQPQSQESRSLFEAVNAARARRKRPLYYHFCVHLSRSLVRIRRSSTLTYLQLLTYIALGLQLATFYGPQIGTLGGCPQLPMSLIAYVLSPAALDDAHNLSGEMRRIQENMNFLLVAVMTTTFAALEVTVITFPLEAKTVRREWRNGWYRVSSYFLGRTLADLPFQLSFVCIFSALIYSLTAQIGLYTWRFGVFVLVMIMVALIAQTVGFMFGAIFMNNLPAAVFTAPLCIFPNLLFSNFFARVSHIPAIYKPFTYLSHFRYAFDALIVTLYGHNRCECDQQALDAYHSSAHNQTHTMRDMFKSLFGSSTDCATQPLSPLEDSTTPMMGLLDEDAPSSVAALLAAHSSSSTSGSTAAPPPLASSLAVQLASNLTSPSVLAATGAGHHMPKALEDALVDRVFEHMNSTSTAAPAPALDGTDLLLDKFAGRITTMLNSQSNYGHEMPRQCTELNSYLMTEFELHDSDLIFGLAMLFVFLVVARLLCNATLALTIATRAR